MRWMQVVWNKCDKELLEHIGDQRKETYKDRKCLLEKLMLKGKF